MDTTEANIIDLFSCEPLVGDPRRGFTPLDQFYVNVAMRGPMFFCPVFIDRSRIHISVEDAKVLFFRLREYINGLVDDEAEAGQHAIEAWLHMGPEVDGEVPQGKAVVFPGLYVVDLTGMPIPSDRNQGN